jgi:hypothetical protein
VIRRETSERLEVARPAHARAAGGRERDEAQWRELLEAPAFEPLSIEDGLIQARCR